MALNEHSRSESTLRWVLKAGMIGMLFASLAFGGFLAGSMGAGVAWAAKYNVPDAPPEFLNLKNTFTSKKDLKRGVRQYKGKCADCHGEEGEGDPDEPGTVVFNDQAYMATRSDGQLFYIIKFGAGEEAEMEAFGPDSDVALSDKKIWQIIAFIRTLSP